MEVGKDLFLAFTVIFCSFYFPSTYCSATLAQWFEWRQHHDLYMGTREKLTSNLFLTEAVSQGHRWRPSNKAIFCTRCPVCICSITRLKPLPCWYIHVLSPANQNLNGVWTCGRQFCTSESWLGFSFHKHCFNSVLFISQAPHEQ